MTLDSVERIDAEVEGTPDRDLSLPPHSLQAEEAVLGSILKSPNSIIHIADRISSDDFYAPRNQHVFRAMASLSMDGLPIDYHSIADRLQQTGLYEAAGGLLYLSQLSLSTPTSAHIEYYAKIIERTSVARKVIQSAQSMAEMAYRDNLAAESLLERSESMLMSISERRVTRDFRPLREILGDYMDEIEAISEGEGMRYGIPSGYTDLDRLLGGFQRTDLAILAARTSLGKTALALNFAINAAVKYRARVGIFSLEMSADQLAARILSMESGVDAPRIRAAHMNEQESRKLDAAINHLAEAPIWVDDTPSIPTGELRAKARRLAAEHQIDFLIVDYLQLIASERRESRVQELSDVTRMLKALARELRVPVLAISQLSRAVEQRNPHIPQLSDLRESGALEQDADVVMFIYREDKYEPDTDKKGIAEIIVAKHRNGPTGQVQLLFLERTTKFLDLEVYRA